MRLQREAAAGLRPEDYADGLDLDLDEDEGVSEADDEDEDEPRTMGGAADRVRLHCAWLEGTMQPLPSQLCLAMLAE